MNKSSGIKLFAVVRSSGSVPPTREESEALLARADEEIELRVQTSFTTVDALENHAQELARAADRVVVSLRHADWHKPYVIRDNPYPIATSKWARWYEEREQERLRSPRIQVADETLIRAIKIAEAQSAENSPTTQQRALVPVEKVFWVARELAGVSEVTLLPAPSTSNSRIYPITAMFASAQGVEAILRGINLLAEGKKPLVAAKAIIMERNAASDAMLAKNTKRIEVYRAIWEQICAIRAYGDPFARFRFCVCRAEYTPPPRDIIGVVRQQAESLLNPIRHEPVCYERLLDGLSYSSDWWLAESRLADEVGERHSLIELHKRRLSDARRDGEG
jgi:hypothetical protein